MLSSYRLTCPYEGCGWTGSLVPSLIQGGTGSEVASLQRGWFHCPGCQRDWEVSISGDAVTVVPTAGPPEAGQSPSSSGARPTQPRRKASVPMDQAPDSKACPKCGAANSSAGMKTLQIEMRPILTTEVFAFPDALAEVNCLKCQGCGHWMCLDYRIELDDNPEIDLNPE